MHGVRLLARLAHVEISSKFSACARFAAHDVRFHFDRSLLVALSWVNAPCTEPFTDAVASMAISPSLHVVSATTLIRRREKIPDCCSGLTRGFELQS